MHNDYRNTPAPDDVVLTMVLPENHEVVPKTVALNFRKSSSATSEERLQQAIDDHKKIYLNYKLEESNGTGERIGIFYYWWHEDNHWVESFTQPFIYPTDVNLWYTCKIIDVAPSETLLKIHYTFLSQSANKTSFGMLILIISYIITGVCIFLCVLLVAPRKKKPVADEEPTKIAPC